MSIPSVLKRIKALRGLSEDDCKAILDNTSLEKVPQGQVLFNEGEEGNALYIIRRGKVRIFKPATPGKQEVEIAVLGEKQFFGEMALIAEQKRSATAITVADSELYVLTPKAFNVLIEKNPDMASRISEEFMRRLNENIRNDIS
ncbi:Crp/Fnr family transcriptional regulator [Candidatus Uabimicrobium amorphum]|uniref:Cyclic AMP receptor protein n=1 Tax=Uabimicrobium amorphum TaxID=2596890 RepID=A0A5S9F4S1_UABAM|nr:cyclic nucleotide-binding domain-containing protein [Candidatus Uabimicrobium amorphum]BBM86076.1 cyclic AMP receptor protein [Candidatus Uabimicrobium amorphum]